MFITCRHGAAQRTIARRYIQQYPTRPHSTHNDLKSHSITDSLSSDQAPSVALTKEELRHQLDLQSPSDVLRRKLLGITALNRGRNINHRLEMLQNEDKRSNTANRKHPYPSRGRPLAPADQCDLSLAMDLLRFQVRACRSPSDLGRVVTKACQNPKAARILASGTIQHQIAVAVGQLEPAWVVRLLNVMFHRFRSLRLALSPEVVLQAFNASAAIFNGSAVRAWLSISQDMANSANPSGHARKNFSALFGTHALRQVLERLASREEDLEKMKEGDAISQCLFGFPELEPGQAPCHLQSLLNLNHADDLAVWLRVLGLCRRIETLKELWEIYRVEKLPRHINLARLYNYDHARFNDRGPLREAELPIPRFIEAFLLAGQYASAWQVFKEAGQFVRPCDKVFTLMLLGGHLEKLPITGELDKSKLAVLECGLAKVLHTRLYTIEKKLGVQWIHAKSHYRRGFHAIRLEPFTRNFRQFEIQELRRMRAVDVCAAMGKEVRVDEVEAQPEEATEEPA